MAPKENDSIEETVSSAELTEVVAELRQLRVSISKYSWGRITLSIIYQGSFFKLKFQ